MAASQALDKLMDSPMPFHKCIDVLAVRLPRPGAGAGAEQQCSLAEGDVLCATVRCLQRLVHK